MNKYQEEYIGKTVVIERSSNKSTEGIKGIIIDETKNTFKIKVQSREVTIMKSNTEFNINGKTIEGNKIMKRPEDRIKLKGR